MLRTSTGRALTVIVAFVLVVSPTGCKTRAIHDPVEVPLPLLTDRSNPDDVDEAIWRAARKQGWVPTRVRSGEVRATWTKKIHSATVAITHDHGHLRIAYEDSENLLRNGDRIHRNYNSLVQRLADRVQREPIVAVDTWPVSE